MRARAKLFSPMTPIRSFAIPNDKKNLRVFTDTLRKIVRMHRTGCTRVIVTRGSSFHTLSRFSARAMSADSRGQIYHLRYFSGAGER